jgi:hypothetical protein
MSRLYVEIVWSRSSPAYYDFLAVSNPTILPLPLPLHLRIPIANLSTSLFRFLAPRFAPALSPSVLNKSARYLIVTGPRWKVPSKFPFYYLCQKERLDYLEILLNENLFL